MVIIGSLHGFSTGAGRLALLRARSAIAWAPRRARSTRSVRIFPRNRVSCAVPPASRMPRFQMATDSSEQGKGPVTQTVQKRLHELISDSTVENGWDQAWKEGVTPWDVGNVTPIIQDLIEKGKLPEGRALVPGCGSGYDVLALANENRHVVGLDISDTVNKVAQKNAADSPKGHWVEFLLADFFEYAPEAPFNLIFDYTFFCAINPSLRPAWAAKMADLLTQDGELITLMFPLAEFDGGPPFAVSIKAYEEVLTPHGFTKTICEDNELAVEGRKSGDISQRIYDLLSRVLKKLLTGIGKQQALSSE